jgi:hypothetical protein
MINPNQLEEAYLDFTQNFKKWAPDGIISVNLTLLHELGLLSDKEFSDSSPNDLTHYFHVIETAEKVVLFNEKFAVWIIPKLIDNQPSTLTFIATLMKEEKLHLEMVFSTTGVYNTPKYILKVLEHFLTEVIDNEALISSIGKKT